MRENEKELYQIKRELSIRKIIIVSIVTVFIISIIVLVSLYISKESFRKWVDINILRKNLTEQDISSIDLDIDKNNQICCYSKYIGILNDKNLKLYNQTGQSIIDIAVNINTALFASNNKYLAIAEKNGQEFCVISDKTYLWEGKVDGEILQIHINKNGYVVLVTTDTTYKSTITVYDASGKQLLKNYLSSTRVIDVSITNDNKYVAFAEIDTSGALIKSNIKIISIEEAVKDSNQAIINSYDADTSKMIVSVEYQEKNNLICEYDNSINLISNSTNNEILAIDNKTTFMSSNLTNSIAYITEESSGIFNSDSVLNIINTSNNQKSIYNFDEVVKEMYTYGNTIGINVGTEIYFVNTNGLLIKKYTSNQEITNVQISSDLAIIIYKDRVEIINL